MKVLVPNKSITAKILGSSLLALLISLGANAMNNPAGTVAVVTVHDHDCDSSSSSSSDSDSDTEVRAVLVTKGCAKACKTEKGSACGQQTACQATKECGQSSCGQALGAQSCNLECDLCGSCVSGHIIGAWSPLGGYATRQSTMANLLGSRSILKSLHSVDERIGIPHSYLNWNASSLACVRAENVNMNHILARGAHFHNVWLQGKFKHVYFDRGAFHNVSFVGSKLRDVDFIGAKLQNVLFQDTTIKARHLQRSNFDQATLENVHFVNCKFKGVTFKDAHMKNVSFDHTSVKSLNKFKNANLWVGDDLHGRYVKLSGKMLRALGAKMSGATETLINLSAYANTMK